MTEKMTIGGQAVIEGVMMMSPQYVAVSVRKGGSIVTKCDRLRKKRRFFGWPFIRGIVNLAMMLIIGIKALLWSASQQSETQDDTFGWKEITLMLTTSIALAVGLFVFLPLFLSSMIVSTKGFLFNIVDGILRIVIFVLYIVLISFMDDVKRLFMYHGAEHKSVYCFEAGHELTVGNVQKFRTEHPRCGTSFIMVVLVVSIIIFSFVTSSLWYIQLLARIILIPVIAGISYELLKISAKNRFFLWMSYPGIWLQKITTTQPTNDQVEVAIASLKTVLSKEKVI